jgi:hypothetical protein
MKIRNNYYLATEIEKEQNKHVSFLEQALFRIFRAP